MLIQYGQVIFGNYHRCWEGCYMPAHVGTYQHMSACPYVLTHTSMQDKVEMVDIGGAEKGFTCRHISAHVGMSICADAYQHADKVQVIGIRGTESDATCWHISANISTCQHVHMCWHMPACKKGPNSWYQRCREWCYMLAHMSTCRHILVHAGMSACVDTCQLADKVQIVCIRDAESDATCWHISGHVGTYQHMSACPRVLTHASVQIRFKWLVSEVLRVVSHVGTYWHMSAHISTCRHVHMCWHITECR